MMNDVDPSNGQYVRIRPLETADLDAIMAVTNNYHTRKYLNRKFPVSRIQEEEWLESVKGLADKREEFIFAIERKDDLKFLGTCSIRDIDFMNRSCSMGIVIFEPANQDKGYGLDAILLLMDFCFNFLNMHRLELEAMEYNERAIHVYRKAGFKEVARKRESHFFAGQYHDILVMDILDGEFWKLHEKGVEG
ncbi:MAG: GNAT family N-acetyltransferase [Promethearchaeota archaeon]